MDSRITMNFHVRQHKLITTLMAALLLSGWISFVNVTPLISQSNMTTEQEYNEAENGKKLVIILNSEIGITYNSDSFISSSGASVEELNNVLQQYSAKAVPMLRRKKVASASSTLANTYFIYPEKNELEELAGELRKLNVIDAAYIKPASEEPGMGDK